MAGASTRYRTVIAIAGALVLALPAGLSAAASRVVLQQSPQPIYAAISLVKEGTLRRQRCGEYQILRATYRGPSNSPDPRLGGIATYTGRISLMPNGTTGIASGVFTFRNNGRVRARATVNGVITQRSVVNGMVNGKLVDPNAQIRANATLIYDDAFSFIVVRLGLESGANSGIAYPAVPRCP
jgi:hypothetical protein